MNKSIDWVKFEEKEEPEEDAQEFSNISILKVQKQIDHSKFPIFAENCPFNFYTGLSDFPIGQNEAKKINDFPGVEIYAPISKYRCVIAVSPKFDSEKVLSGITKKLTQQESPKENSEQEKANIVECYAEIIDNSRQQLNAVSPVWYVLVDKNNGDRINLSLNNKNSSLIKDLQRFVATSEKLHNIEVFSYSDK